MPKFPRSSPDEHDIEPPYPHLITALADCDLARAHFCDRYPVDGLVAEW